MSDATGPRLVRIGGVDLKPLLVEDLIEFSDRVWLDRREQLLETLDKAHADDAMRLKALQDHEPKRGMPDLVFQWAWSMTGAKAIIERAAKNAGVSMPDLSGVEASEFVRAAASLIFPLKADPKAEAGQQ